MAALLEGLRALGSGRVLDEVLGLVMDSAIAVSGAERGFIMLCDESGELEFKVGRARGRVTLPGSRFETSRNIPVEVFRTGRSRMEADLLESPLPLFAWHVVARSFAHVDLPRPRDLLLGIQEHFLPLGDPSDRPGNSEQHGEHIWREAHGLIDQARVEIHVRVEPAFDEVLVLEGDPLELESDVQQWIPLGDLEHAIGNRLDDLGSRIVRLVDAVAKAHQPFFAILYPLGERRHVRDRADLR